MTSPGEGVTVFTPPYLSAGAPALGEAKGLNEINELNEKNFKSKLSWKKELLEQKKNKFKK